MPARNPAVAGAALAAALILAGCGGGSEPELPSPAQVQQVAGSPVPQVKLTAPAIRRIGIATQTLEMAKVSLDGQSGDHKVIPYSAVVYDTDGSTWTYVNTAPQVFLREPVTVGAIDGDTAILTAGPDAGAAVVTVGAAELLGTEYNISGEE
jgi:multidrug efflux pump subunit AcrA (membrane-fusion protein)